MVNADDELESDGAKLIDLRVVGNVLNYGLGSIRRRKGLFVGLAILIIAATVSSLYLLPKTYHVEAKLLIQHNQALALKNENTNDAPTHAAVETIMRRDNLIAIIHQTDLLHNWYNRRAPLAHLKDVVYHAIARPETEAEETEWMADLLEKKMTAWTTDGVVGVAIDWPDQTMALRLVEAAEQNYLEARHATEITAIGEQIGILQNHAEAMRKDVDAAVDVIEKVRAQRNAKLAAGPVTAAPSPIPAPSGGPTTVMTHRSSEPDPELAQLKVTIEAKQRAIADLEEFRRRHLSELQSQLAEKSATYTENHPVIIDLKQTIAASSVESPQVKSLRAEVAQLEAQFKEKSASAAAEQRVVPVLASGGGPVAAPPPLPGNIIRIEQESDDERDPAMMYARTQLKDAMEKYSQLRAQIESAQIDFDTAEAAFKYRYSVVQPPLYPKHPSKPKAAVVVVAGILGGIFVGIFAAVVADVRRGRFVERWEVERTLDLPTLGEVTLAMLEEHKVE
ncbi:MAG TPA: hypothetical protein VGG39_21890 [Polyangiaceae bacterium]|jgi:uncharacterized protein involved in exopolysaccharide biosynthesis